MSDYNIRDFEEKLDSLKRECQNLSLRSYIMIIDRKMAFGEMDKDCLDGCLIIGFKEFV